MMDADTALRYLRDLPDSDVLVTAPHQRTTGLTVADLRELLEAARDGGWRDASVCRPVEYHEPDVAIELTDGSRCSARYYGSGVWTVRAHANDPGCLIPSQAVRRWRERPR